MKRKEQAVVCGCMRELGGCDLVTLDYPALVVMDMLERVAINHSDGSQDIWSLILALLLGC